MNIQIAADQADDTAFIDLLNSLLRGVAVRCQPEELYVVQIDNWFDHKWLRFSGNGSVYFPFPAFMNRFDAAKHAFHQEKVTFPPFTPNRIVSQRRFERVSRQYAETPAGIGPHSTEQQRSARNLHRRIADLVSSACFVWYSSNTLVNGKASIMVYTVMRGEVASWFASFNRNSGWKLEQTKGRSKEDIQELMQNTG
jgi:hypothetical protein